MRARSPTVRSRATHVVSLFAALVLLFGTGCQAASVRLLSLIGLENHPLSVAIVTDKAAVAAQGFNPFPAYRALQHALAKELGRPVAVDVCFPFQAQAGFSSGWYDLAIVTPAQLHILGPANTLRVLAVSADKQGRALHSAVLVVRADSALETATDLRGKVVAFGPVDDALLHHAALQLLRSAGLKPADLAHDVLSLPDALRHLPDGRAVAQAVLTGSAAAGFVDDGTWAALSAQDAREGEPTRDTLRTIGWTIALPADLVVAAPRLDKATADRVRAFLLSVSQKCPEVMQPLASSGYVDATKEMLAACCSLIPVETETQPATQPGDGG